MEPLAAFSEGEWDSFNKLLSIEDQLDFSQQFLHQFSFPWEHDEGFSFVTPSNFFPNPQVNDIFMPSPNALHAGFHYNSLEPYNLAASNPIAAATIDITKITDSFPPAFPNTVNVVEELSTHVARADNELLLKRVESHAQGDKINRISTDSTKKRPRASKDPSKVDKNVHYSKRNRRNNNVNGNEGECNMVADHGHSSSTTCSSEDDNVSQDTNGVANSGSVGSQALNSNGKTRASRGSATDPQSLYARKRRERINERLRVLQNLVPNGTKVDISTMLEEAVHYVKFLQLQIKLLSSDDLWMYAPIAYNGVDVGLNKKISTLL
ncbi:hypothetical protein V6N13_059148 [Hibiscus sabdariffa]|uniref:BHLH domain-containing protein n=1 Tax=Hibiscus sabdariffa TaxID=183260 RepID=A0ABR2GES1_9ROSI